MSHGRKEIRIVGGGLAGLSLGIALRREDIPVTLYEAGSYPRHKVCGEFIAGLAPETIESLGIEDLLSDAKRHSSLRWFRQGESFRTDRLKRPALGISRYRLDERLVQRFVELGGRLEIGERKPLPFDGEEGLVWAAGRAKHKSAWIGSKMHCRAFQMADDLEMHLGRHGYVGVSAVESGRVNICGLFRAKPLPSRDQRPALLNYLKGRGFESLAERIEAGDPDWGSHCVVSAMSFGAGRPMKHCIQIGDAFSLMPPFAGDGMAMCFEGAVAVLDPIRDYVEGRSSWQQACRESSRALSAQFRTRLAVGRSLHPFLYRTAGHLLFKAASHSRLLPFPQIFELLHRRQLC